MGCSTTQCKSRYSFTGCSPLCHPLQVQHWQNNNYDCGIWVLAAIIAVLRGWHVTGVREVDIGDLRHYLSTLVLSIPPNV
jgi:hypothetical protein